MGTIFSLYSSILGLVFCSNDGTIVQITVLNALIIYNYAAEDSFRMSTEMQYQGSLRRHSEEAKSGRLLSRAMLQLSTI